jgi:hypothetical protein
MDIIMRDIDGNEHEDSDDVLSIENGYHSQDNNSYSSGISLSDAVTPPRRTELSGLEVEMSESSGLEVEMSESSGWVLEMSESSGWESSELSDGSTNSYIPNNGKKLIYSSSQEEEVDDDEDEDQEENEVGDQEEDEEGEFAFCWSYIFCFDSPWEMWLN